MQKCALESSTVLENVTAMPKEIAAVSATVKANEIVPAIVEVSIMNALVLPFIIHVGDVTRMQ